MGNAATKEIQQQQQHHHHNHHRQRASSLTDPDDILNFASTTSASASSAAVAGSSSSSSTPSTSSSSSSRRRRASSSVNTDTLQHHHRKGKSKKQHPPPEPVQILVLDTSETVDGGYLQPQGVYTGPQDFKYKVVRQLIIDRKIAPFYKGLNDYKQSWSDRQLLAAVRGLPIPEDANSNNSTSNNNKNNQLTEGSTLSQNISQQQDTDNVTTTTSQTSFSSSGSLAVPSISTASTSLDIDLPVPTSIAEDLVDSPDALIPLMPATSSSAPSHSFMPKDSLNNVSHSTSTYTSITPPPHAHIHYQPIHQPYKDISTSSSSNNTNTNTTTTTNTNTNTNTTTTISTTTTASSPPLTISPTSASPITRSRANTTSRYGPSPLGAPQKPPTEVLVYRGAIECPICFLYYPKYLNLTRCCAQPICTECFVQIKRPDPHPPHDDHENNDNNNTSSTPNQNLLAAEPMLVSEPACCPYCMIPDFGITYTPCPYRSGLEPKKQHSGPTGVASLLPLANIFSLKDDASSVALDDSAIESSPSPGNTPASSTSALSSTLSSCSSPTSTVTATKRRGSIPANSPDVVTIDRIRPDWSIKLAAARAHAARKAAQATALHASAFLLDNNQPDSTSGGRSRGSRGSTSRGLGSSGGNRRRSSASANNGRGGSAVENNPRIQQLEDIMVMEAIRLSLIEEESRKLKEQQASSDGAPAVTGP
ncbi:uncharacterized protein SAPINGB_P002503 [Magnusiomyces paraingens]|uniref:Protein SIP5 n=1 Tax=Magnusiomyces paraingens TaxID=2606893 RepID=A0A5E8BK06_9ASCO|nr:uncharacterized protein SAPINGB_P002503 [Saprochaete ingens]VVT49907.1 unnamed protein product [Saprochaete ingens]